MLALVSLQMQLSHLFTDYCSYLFKTLPNDKILDLSKFVARADNKINVIQNLNYVLPRVEDILGNGENAAGYQHFFSFFQKCFQSAFFVKGWDWVVKG